MRRIVDRLGWGVAAALALALVAVVAGIVRAGPLDPPGAPGSTPGVRLPGTPITQPASFPIALDQPGSYYLAGNITGVSGKDGIHIVANNVTLDLNGFTVAGVPGSGYGILVMTNYENAVIRGGTVTAWDVGIRSLSTGGRMDHVTVSDSKSDGVQIVGDDTVLEDCRVASNGSSSVGAGIKVTGFYNRVEQCTVVENAAQGIDADGASNYIARNMITGNGASCCTGLWSHGAGNTLDHNTATANGNAGFYIDAATVAVANIASFNLASDQFQVTSNCSPCGVAPTAVAGSASYGWHNIVGPGGN